MSWVKPCSMVPSNEFLTVFRYVDTPLTHDYIVSGALDVELQHSAIGRPDQVDEIANAILFLSSPMSSYMFGSALVIDGGYSA